MFLRYISLDHFAKLKDHDEQSNHNPRIINIGCKKFHFVESEGGNTHILAESLTGIGLGTKGKFFALWWNPCRVCNGAPTINVYVCY